MNIHWSLSKEDQVTYYLIQARRIQKGFFQRIRAVVLPYLHNDAWYFPDYALFENGAFKKKLESVNYDQFEANDDELRAIVLEKFDFYIQKADIEKDTVSFENDQEKFFAICEEFLPSFNSIKKLTIVPTKFGTGSSYFTDKKDPTQITITYRLDRGYQRVFQSVLSILVQNALSKDDTVLSEWKERKGISDFLVAHTAFSEFFEEAQKHKTLEFLEDYKGELLEESASYFAKMGYPIASSLSYSGDSIMFNGKPIVGLTNKEIDVLKLLIDKRSQIVSFDEVGDIYWKDNPDKFSLASLAKVIEKLRNTLEQNGIPESYIRTVRKRGYLLFD
jgi:hypothetical protein